mmetsp:Transcript_3862/g.5500  ORF Transcript_3862/g.5500 Transcript_3862/m.5500 type:complete len:282 (-) Transcript_3862:569-1414(-)
MKTYAARLVHRPTGRIIRDDPLERLQSLEIESTGFLDLSGSPAGIGDNSSSSDNTNSTANINATKAAVRNRKELQQQTDELTASPFCPPKSACAQLGTQADSGAVSTDVVIIIGVSVILVATTVALVLERLYRGRTGACCASTCCSNCGMCMSDFLGCKSFFWLRVKRSPRPRPLHDRDKKLAEILQKQPLEDGQDWLRRLTSGGVIHTYSNGLMEMGAVPPKRSASLDWKRPKRSLSPILEVENEGNFWQDLRKISVRSPVFRRSQSYGSFNSATSRNSE